MSSESKGGMNGHHKDPAGNAKGPFDDVVIQESQFGVYRLCVASSKRTVTTRRLTDFFPSGLDQVWRLCTDVYAIDAPLLILFVSVKLLSSIQSAYFMKLSNDMLHNTSVSKGTPFIHVIARTIVVRTLVTFIMTAISWGQSETEGTLKRKVTSHFRFYLMKAQMNRDIPTSQDATSYSTASAESGWDSFSKIVETATSLTTLIGHVLVTTKAAKESGGPIFLLLCLFRPIAMYKMFQAQSDAETLAYVNNPDYLRLMTLKSCVSSIPQRDILSGNLGNWILSEYTRAWRKVENLTQAAPGGYQQRRSRTVYQMRNVLWRILDDISLMFYAFTVLRNSSTFSLADLAILESTSQALTDAIYCAIDSFQDLDGLCIQPAKSLYQAGETTNIVVDGALSYPEPEAEAQREGMEIAFENVSFSYPGAPDTTLALRDLNLQIAAGSLVVIVGGNGSGKSTLINILARLYDPSSGELSIDGRPAKDYRIHDIREASVFLSQENMFYRPLSFAENIGLGCVEHVNNMEMIEDAARKGGAADFIAKLETKYDTFLKQKAYAITHNLGGDEKKGHPLNKRLKELEKRTNVSGGERQRIVAARSFMRLNSGKVKLVAVDEPSSAMDAEGELALFTNLLEAREGKTMIFVTHRFGHLTKKADLIVCMKDGTIAEMGTHRELMTKAGEYAKLYDIQAKAFPDEQSVINPVES